METKRLIDDNESINSDDANLNDYLFRFRNNRRFEEDEEERRSKTSYLFNMIFNKIINRKTNGHNDTGNTDYEQESPSTATETTAMNSNNNNNSKKENNKKILNNRYK